MNVLKRLSPKKPPELITFIEEILMLQDETFEKYNIRNTDKITQNQRFLSDFLRYLRN